MDKDKYKEVKEIVRVDIEEIISLDREMFLDLISERAVGHSCLSCVSYKIVKGFGSYVELEVVGFDEIEKDEYCKECGHKL